MNSRLPLLVGAAVAAATALAMPTVIGSAAPAAAQSTQIDLDKTSNGVDADAAPGPMVATDQSVTWTWTVTAIGTEALVDIAVSDSSGVAPDCDLDGDGAGDGTSLIPGPLQPGRSVHCRATVAAGDQIGTTVRSTGMVLARTAGGVERALDATHHTPVAPTTPATTVAPRPDPAPADPSTTVAAANIPPTTIPPATGPATTNPPTTVPATTAAAAATTAGGLQRSFASAPLRRASAESAAVTAPDDVETRSSADSTVLAEPVDDRSSATAAGGASEADRAQPVEAYGAGSTDGFEVGSRSGTDGSAGGVTGSAEPLPALEPTEVAAPPERRALASTSRSTILLAVGALLVGLGCGLLLARSGTVARVPAKVEARIRATDPGRPDRRA